MVLWYRWNIKNNIYIRDGGYDLATKMLTMEEVAAIFRFSNEKTSQLINTPGFPKLKIGREYRIPEDELDKWIKKYSYTQFNME